MEGRGQEIGIGGSGSMEGQLHEFVREVRSDLGRLERRLDYLDQRVTGLDRRVTREDDRITRVASEVAGRISRIDHRITALQQRMREAASDGSSVGALEPRSLLPLD